MIFKILKEQGFKAATGLLWAKYKVFIALALVAANLAVMGYFYYIGYTFCEDRVLIKTVEKSITIKEKQNEIRNNKPTVSTVTVRLHNATF